MTKLVCNAVKQGVVSVCIYVNGCKHENTQLLRAALGFQAHPPSQAQSAKKLSKGRGEIDFLGDVMYQSVFIEYFSMIVRVWCLRVYGVAELSGDTGGIFLPWCGGKGNMRAHEGCGLTFFLTINIYFVPNFL